MTAAEKLAQKFREFAESQKGVDESFNYTYYSGQPSEVGSNSREADSGTDEGCAIFCILFESEEFNVHITPTPKDAE